MYESIFVALSLLILLEEFVPKHEGEICMTGRIPDVPDGGIIIRFTIRHDLSKFSLQ